jgi:hypothetical protein
MARRALAHLEEQIAGFGTLHVPTHLKIELEEKRREVANLEAQMTHLVNETTLSAKTMSNQQNQYIDTQTDMAGDPDTTHTTKTIKRTTRTKNVSIDNREQITHNDTNSITHTDTIVLRQMLQYLDDTELDSLCIDHFFTVYNKFGTGFRRDTKINLLLDYCYRNPRAGEQLRALLNKIT